MNEYDYMRSLVLDRYQAKRDEAFISLRTLHQSAVTSCDYDRAILLGATHDDIQSRLCMECITAEEIISWLEIDSDLRKENLTYPDIFDLCT